jgi:hypothetical protein
MGRAKFTALALLSNIKKGISTADRQFKVTIVNGRDFPLQIRLLDRVAVSEIKNIKVSEFPDSTKPTQRYVDDERGLLEWDFQYAPGEKRVIRFGYKVRGSGLSALIDQID